MEKVATILCDIDGVAVNRFTVLSANDFCTAHSIDPDAFSRASSEAARGLDIGQKQEIDYFAEVAGKLSLDMTPDELQNYFVAADAKNIQRNERLYAWLDAKSVSGMMVGAATNVSRELAARLSGMGLYDVFQKTFFSYEIGASKTERRFWDHVLGDLSVAPGSIAFIDDNKDNVAAAQASGIQGFVYRDFDQVMGELSAEMR